MSDKEILLPRTASRYISEHSVDVKVSRDGVEKTSHKACDVVYLCSYFSRRKVISSSVQLLMISRLIQNHLSYW